MQVSLNSACESLPGQHDLACSLLPPLHPHFAGAVQNWHVCFALALQPRFTLIRLRDDILFHASGATLRKVQRICLEYHDRVAGFSHRDLAGYLQSKGFRVRLTPNLAHRHLGFLFAWREA